MKTIKINVTNEDGELLDHLTLTVVDAVQKLAVRIVPPGHVERLDEDALEIGAGD